MGFESECIENNMSAGSAPSTFKVRCPKCNIGYQVDDSVIGQEAVCECGNVFAIRRPDASQSSASVANSSNATFKVYCPACRAKYEINSGLIGQEAVCDCGKTFTLQKPEGAPQSSPAQPRQSASPIPKSVPVNTNFGLPMPDVVIPSSGSAKNMERSLTVKMSRSSVMSNINGTIIPKYDASNPARVAETPGFKPVTNIGITPPRPLPKPEVAKPQASANVGIATVQQTLHQEAVHNPQTPANIGIMPPQPLPKEEVTKETASPKAGEVASETNIPQKDNENIDTMQTMRLSRSNVMNNINGTMIPRYDAKNSSGVQPQPQQPPQPQPQPRSQSAMASEIPENFAVTCSKCGTTYEVTREFIGKEAECECGYTFKVEQPKPQKKIETLKLQKKVESSKQQKKDVSVSKSQSRRQDVKKKEVNNAKKSAASRKESIPWFKFWKLFSRS